MSVVRFPDPLQSGNQTNLSPELMRDSPGPAGPTQPAPQPGGGGDDHCGGGDLCGGGDHRGGVDGYII